jgi:predicted MFS family arabinose efflux permease
MRKAVPETEEWTAAQQEKKIPSSFLLFGPGIRRTTWIAMSLCAISLTGHWTFMFWQQGFILQHPEVSHLPEALKQAVPLKALFWMMVGSLFGNFGAGWLAKRYGYQRALSSMFLVYFALMFTAFMTPWSLTVTYGFYAAIGFVQGVFALFTMALPPLFPTLLRTTGAGFCYNFGRIFAAIGTVFFGIFAKVGDFSQCLWYASFLFVPAAVLAWWLPREE